MDVNKTIWNVSFHFSLNKIRILKISIFIDILKIFWKNLLIY